MSFNKQLKEEIFSNKISDNVNLLYEYQALFDFLGSVEFKENQTSLVFSTYNSKLIRYFIKLTNILFSISLNSIKFESVNIKQKKKFYVEFNEMSDFILEKIKYFDARTFFETDELNNDSIIYYLKGSFLACGSISDPIKKNYHMEFSSTNINNILYVQFLLNKLDLNAKVVNKKNSIECYIKKNENILFLINSFGAMKSYFSYEEIIVNRSMTSSIKSTINLDIANEQKALNNANKELEAIRLIKKRNIKLDSNLDYIIKLRTNYTDASYNELVKISSEVFGINISKTTLCRRFKKIIEISTN